jgi:Protein of unknown function (DUF3866)
MALTLRRGTVSAIVERHEGLVRLEVDGRPCVAYPDLTGPVALGDDVLVNAQARELELGSGGFDILHANLTRGLELRSEQGAHVMKLPYTSLQHAVVHAEESASLPYLLDMMPVVACTLHSQLAPVCAALAGYRVVYVQLPGGALPVALSDTVRTLKRRGMLELSISQGPCYGGDLECVSVHTALLAARGIGADAVVCGIGPGVVGTGSTYGHGGMAAWHALVAADELEGRAILTVRMSEADTRQRHRGVSHHADAVLYLTQGTAVDVAWPMGCPFERPKQVGVLDVDATGWRDACADLPLDHMGRGPDEDPWFFAAAFAAGRLARRVLE